MGKSTNAVALVWDKPDAGGPKGTGDVAAAATGDATLRYDAWDFDTMADFGWGDPGTYGVAWKISSVSLFAPVTGASVIIFYSDGARFPFSTFTRFDRFFLLIDNRTGKQLNVNLADRPLLDDGGGSSLPNWENAPTSMILVHTAQGPERRLAAAATLSPTWNNLIDKQLKDGSSGAATVTRKGNPSWDWIPFPRGKEFLNPNGNYLRVYQDIHVALDDPLPDYKAWLAYYLKIVPSNGTVTGRVARWEYGVEGGLFTDLVDAVLRPNVMLGAEKMNDFLAGGFPLPPGINVKSLYYLPGVQTDATQPGEAQIFQGFTNDATIVLETA